MSFLPGNQFPYSNVTSSSNPSSRWCLAERRVFISDWEPRSETLDESFEDASSSVIFSLFVPLTSPGKSAWRSRCRLDFHACPTSMALHKSSPIAVLASCVWVDGELVDSAHGNCYVLPSLAPGHFLKSDRHVFPLLQQRQCGQKGLRTWLGCIQVHNPG